LKQFSIDRIRNIALASHQGAGKTTLVEAMLYTAGATTRMGRVDEGNSFMDFDPDEIERKTSISLSMAHLEWKDTLLNLIDTPGYADFMGEVIAGLQATDTIMVLLDATSGVDVGTERWWTYATDNKIPRVLVMNKMHKENARYRVCYQAALEILGKNIAPLQIPIGEEQEFHGIVDLLTMEAFIAQDGNIQKTEIPQSMADTATEMREQLIEAIAETDEELTEKYLEEETLGLEDLQRGLKRGIAEGTLAPLFVVDALGNIGTAQLLDRLVTCLPSPADLPGLEVTKPGSDEVITIKRDPENPLTGQVFKTAIEPHVGELSLIRVFSGILRTGTEVFNAVRGTTERINQIYMICGKERTDVDTLTAGQLGALVKLKETKTGDTLCEKNNPLLLPSIDFPAPSISVAIRPKSRDDEEKVSSGLTRLQEEDPTFTSHYDSSLRQILIAGLGELHLDVIINRLKTKFGVAVDLEKPRIAYQETIGKRVEVQGKYKRQTGGRGQYGDVWVRFEPLSRGEGFEFVDKIVGGAIPNKFIPSVEKGIMEALREGVLAGYPTVDFKASLYDGSFHSVDSSDMAFKIAGSMAFQKGAEQANPILLEPILDVEVTVPEEYMGDIMGDLSARRGRIQGMDTEGRLQRIRASVPEAEMYKYSTQLRSMTQGRGTFVQKFSHYEEVPKEIADRIIAEAKEAKQRESK
jgi:elongation factor G